MLVRSSMRLELEIIRWIALIVLATALALLLATQAAGGGSIRDARAPGLLPPEMDEWARPMAEPSDSSGFAEPFATAEGIWRALEQHRAGDPLGAIEAWQQIHMPGSSEVWKQVALSMAYLQSRQTGEAARVLAYARQLDSENAMVMYMIGILRLDQADEAEEWYDALGPSWIRLATQRTVDAVPNTRSMYEMAAMQAFEQAIEWSGRVRRDEPLVPESWCVPEDYELVMPVAVPRVADLLEVLEAVQFEGKSHWVLGELYTERGAWEHAEEHLDHAREARFPTGAAFRKLGKAYEGAGMHADAARAFLKAMSPEAGVLGPAESALENLRKSLLGTF